ncbi:hypothetical protein JCM10207_000305 [Rhodosporidiobolus poonsookiae]
MRPIALSLLALPLLNLAAAAKPPALSGDPLSDTYCDEYTNGDSPDVALCSTLFDVTGTVFFQTSSISGNVDTVLTSIMSLLGGDDSLLGGLLGPILSGVVGNLGYSATSALEALPQLLSNAAPQCRCDLAQCYTKLTSTLQAARSADDEAAVSSSCSVAMYACAPYYSTSDINSVIPECAEFFCDAQEDPDCATSSQPEQEAEEEEESGSSDSSSEESGSSEEEPEESRSSDESTGDDPAPAADEEDSSAPADDEGEDATVARYRSRMAKRAVRPLVRIGHTMKRALTAPAPAHSRVKRAVDTRVLRLSSTRRNAARAMFEQGAPLKMERRSKVHGKRLR